MLKDFDITEKEIAVIYASVNGNINNVRTFLDGKKCVRWDKLEDLALAMPEGSPQFEILLQTKGMREISERR